MEVVEQGLEKEPLRLFYGPGKKDLETLFMVRVDTAVEYVLQRSYLHPYSHMIFEVFCSICMLLFYSRFPIDYISKKMHAPHKKKCIG